VEGHFENDPQQFFKRSTIMSTVTEINRFRIQHGGLPPALPDAGQRDWAAIGNDALAIAALASALVLALSTALRW
jgi:hypothetical protein